MPVDGERTLEKQRTSPTPPVAGSLPAAPDLPDVPGLDAVAVPGLAATVRRRAATDDPLGGTAAAPEVGEALRRRKGGGRPLEPAVAERMGAAMGADLDGVRIHDDGEADTIARSVQATAFTAGTDIYFTRGTYAPGTSSGDHLLGHELAHVVQGGGAASAAGGPTIGEADDPAEAAADAMADKAVRRLQRQASRVGDGIARSTAEPAEEAAGGTGALRRQAARVGSPTIRRWNPFKRLLGGKKKKKGATLPSAPLASALSPEKPTVRPPEQTVPVPQQPLPEQTVPQQTVPQQPVPEQTVPQPEASTPVQTQPDPVDGTVTQPEATPPTEAQTPPEQAVDTPVTQPETAPQTDTQTPPEQVASTPTSEPQSTAEQTTAQAVEGTVPDTAPQQPQVLAPQKSAKERFEEACDPQTAPASKTDAKARMDVLRQLINTFSGAEKKSIADDGAAMAKGRAHLGDLYYMSLLAAVDMAKKKTTSGGKKVKHHLTGAEADAFIKTNIEDYPHIKPFIAAAVSAGKKGEGYVASISPEDWAVVYAVEFPNDSAEEEASTNAYASTKNADEPAILHADRGTPSTAIHESMHRYAPNGVLDTFGFDLNEGMTEFFTRMLTTKDATPTKDGGAERTNYNAQVTFVRDKLIPLLGSSKVDQETLLGEIYFEGKVEKIEAKFRAAWKAKDAKISTSKLDSSWTKFKKAISDGAWSDATKLLPKA